MFDLSLPKLLVLAVIALVIFGPDELPKIAARPAAPSATCARSPRAP